MSASVADDKLTAVENGGTPVPTTVSSNRSIGSTDLSCVSLSNWPTTTAVHFITYQKNADGSINDETLCLWKGIVSGTTIGSLTAMGGTVDAGNSVGDFVEMAPTSSYGQGIYNWGTTQHNTDGTHKNVTTDTLTVSSSVSLPASSVDSDTLAESARWPEVGRSSTVSSNKISVTLDGTYKYLHIIGHVTNNSATSANIFVRLNGDSGGNYAYQYLTLNNSTVSGTTGTSGTSLLAQSSVGQYELIQIVADIEKFTSLNWAQATGKIGSGANNRTRQYLSSQWQNTTDVITSVSVEFDAGTLSGELVVLGHN